jgi:SAM-dependent methyltransferase
MTDTPDIAHWSAVAEEWIAWARKPGHDAFWAYRDAFLDFVGLRTGDVLDVGCGEGRISRELKRLGYTVTACDGIAAMVDAARDADSADHYAVAPAAALPFPNRSFDKIVAYNLLMDVEDVPTALREFARVLRPDGELIISLVHPFVDRGRFESDAPGARFVIDGDYFGREHFEGTETRDGLSMHFAGWSLPLETYAQAIFAAGLAISGLAEPKPAPTATRLTQRQRLPLFLWLKAKHMGQ